MAQVILYNNRPIVIVNGGAAGISSGGGLTINSTVITGGTAGRLLTSGATVGELTLGTGVSTWLTTPSWANFNSAITGTAPFWKTSGTTTISNSIIDVPWNGSAVSGVKFQTDDSFVVTDYLQISQYDDGISVEPTIELHSTNTGAGTYSYIRSSKGLIKLGFTTDSEVTGGNLFLNSSANSILFEDLRVTKRGIEYAADYSADYTTRSLVDKAYVDAGPFIKRAGTSSLTSNALLDGAFTLDFSINNLKTFSDRSFGIGGNALSSYTTGFIGNNYGFGAFALSALTTGERNLAFGSSAMSSLTTSNFNIGIGEYAGQAATGNGNIIIGHGVKVPVDSGDGQINIANILYGVNAYYSTSYSSTPQANGRIGIGVTTPTARLHLPAGTAAASSAPLRFTSGTNLTTPVSGAVEFNGTDLFYTNSTPTRRTVVNLDATQALTNKTVNGVTLTTGGSATAYLNGAGAYTTPASGWSLTGNAGTVDGTNFIGTTDNIPFNIRVNNEKSGRIEATSDASTFLFQFHNGAIKSWIGSRQIHQLKDFNSIMVRLKE